MNYLSSNKNSLDPSIPVKRKTRIEDLEDRIANAESFLEALGDDLKNEGLKEVNKLNMVLDELKALKEKVSVKGKDDDKKIESEVKNISSNSLILINNEKVKVRCPC